MRLLLLCLLFTVSLSAQVRLEIECADCPTPPALDTQLPDSVSALQELQHLRVQYLRQGYAETSFDSVAFNFDSVEAHLHLGPVYEFGKIYIDSSWQENIEGVNLESIEGQRLTPESLDRLLTGVLERVLQSGYPLARVQLDQVRIQHHRLSAKIKVEEGPFVTYAPLKVEGSSLRPQYLSNLLNIKAGSAFDIRDIRRIEKLMSGLDFVALAKPPSMRITGQKAVLTLQLKKKKSNRFFFLIGALPNSGNDGRLQITGNVLIDMKNLLSYGERFYLKFDQVRPLTQQFEIKSNLPYPLDFPLTLSGAFALYKQDTAYLDASYRLAGEWKLSNSSQIGIFIRVKKSKLLTINKNQLLLTRQLPDNLDYSLNELGLSWTVNRTDRPLNPRKGYRIRLESGVGILKKPVNPKIAALTIPGNPGFSFRTLYDSIPRKSQQVRPRVSASVYLPFGKRSVAALSNNSGFIFSSAPPALNEQWQLGGYRLLRGFNERAIQAPSFAVTSLEYKYLLGGLSSLFVFADYGITASFYGQLSGFDTEQLIGLGAGMQFETQNSLINVSVALGKRDRTPIDYRAAKIHLGYQALF